MSRRIEAGVSEAELLRVAQGYLSRRAASMLQLRQALMRRLTRRFAGSEEERPDKAAVDGIVDRVVQRIAEAGLIDEAALAQSRTDALARKGLARNVIRRRLALQGLDPEDGQAEALASIDDERQARRFAQRKRLGAWHSGQRQISLDRDMRSMARAGFSPELSRRVLKGGDDGGANDA